LLSPFEGKLYVGVPVGEGGLFVLAGASGWFFWALPNHFEPPSDMHGMVGDAKFEANGGGDAAAGPELSL